MNNFCLGNACSYNLNFLLYINNLYTNYNGDYEYCELTDIFPWIPINKNSLLAKSEFDIRAEKFWKIILDLITNPETDASLWFFKKVSFCELFNAEAAEDYRIIEKSFFAWFSGTCETYCSMFSTHLLHKFYDKIINMAKERGITLKNTTIYLQTVYDKPPETWGTKNNNMLIISPAGNSPNGNIPRLEDLFNICRE